MSIVPASRKVPAGILGILLGSLGVHKFFLGFNRAGAVMLAITVLGWLTGWLFGIGHLLVGAMSLLGFIEGIIYLVRSDSDFYNTYFVRRQEWL
ncbi:MAG TPA: hypothetical protein VG944_17255 [Fimbriimonas sp.]|nr:hypothetical protein [Fimbriimonas sp.]